ncbi:hypothetical protein GCM10022381_00470 [Leifsonia kafniensis]|uniref:Uncharacterized protein n=1 Tax=Leifsonia kafniensis TaxID=475957 RepID=A0ABP7K138_9MICO
MVLVATTVKANQVTSRPTLDSLTPSDSLISGSSPVGSISDVIDRKMAAARVIRPTQGKEGEATDACGTVVLDMKELTHGRRIR